MNKRIIAVILSLTMLLATASCGKERPYLNAVNPHANDVIDRTKAPTVITYLTIGDKPHNGQTEKAIEELNRILERRLNAHLDIYYVGWNDYLRNYNLILSSEDSDIDLVGTSSDWLDAWSNVIKGNFLPLSEDMLRDYCSITYANVTPRQWENCKYEGDIYLIPENEYSQWTNHGFIYRKDIANEAGLKEIASFEDMDTYFETVIQKHPEMIPWDRDRDGSALTEGYLMSASRYVPIYELTGYGIWGQDMTNPGKIISPYYEGTDFVDFAKLMKKWNSMGVWRRDVNDAGENEEEFYRGESSVIQHHTQKYYTSVQPTMTVRQPGVNLDFFWFGRESGNIVRLSNIHGAMAVSSRSKNPEMALLVYDMIRNDTTCYRLMRYGVEGEQYQILENGMLERPSGYNEEQDSITTNFWWGRRDEMEIPDAAYDWDAYYELIDDYEHLAIQYPFEGVPFSTPAVNEEVESIKSIFDTYIPQISSGQYEGTAEEKVQQFREELKKAGFERITGHLQRILDNY
ncbi:DUF3502 domain-containing protein [Butyrivibrio sp. FCS014]|uniref:DUF3502 domain-containing protein n=1 Tax=Butyrivibrio sp. FCS014 TaxID=1408304 RepID=UPI0004632C36|nr:DUF3502 domain-containing protein [Butyrivibrio sp. FCS014]